MPEMTPWKKIILSIFILFHMLGCVTWVMWNSEVRRSLVPVVQNYVIWLGIWQSWDMFSPDPSNLNMYVHATLTNSDGTTTEYSLPRMDKLGFLDRYDEERYRKYVENIHLDDHSIFWRDLSRWIVHQNEQITRKTVVRIALTRTWWFVPPAPPDTSQPPQPDWKSFKFYQTNVVNGEPQ